MNKDILDIVIKEFMKLTEIPRPSHHEEKISEYLYQWAFSHHLKAEKDELNDVIIEKPASPGCENAPLVIFQAHMDMVCVAAEGVKYDPLTDPIKVINDGKTLRADGTSLGADDGIGIAMCLYLLQDDTLRHGPIRVIITANEEDGMDSMHMDAKYLAGEYLINLDWETIGSLCNSCAGGDFYNFSCASEWITPYADGQSVEIRFSNLLGGHSGVGINKGHANALVSIATLMSMMKQAGIDYQIAEFTGGQAPNAIPKFGKINFVIPKGYNDKLNDVVENFKQEFKDAFDNIEPEYDFIYRFDNDMPARVLTSELSQSLIGLMTVVPNNVHTMSPFVDGLVESSSNLGGITINDSSIHFTVFERSSVVYHATQIGVICKALADAYGFDFNSDGHVPGWAVNPNSKLTEIACDQYKKLTGNDMIVEPVHAGVECGAFAEKNPNLDMIAIGPTLLDVHTPNESCCLEDVKTTTELLVMILNEIADSI